LKSLVIKLYRISVTRNSCYT